MKSRFLTFACAAFVVAVNAVCAAGDSVPDRISRSGVAIDFSQQEPSLMIESGTSLQKVASVASDWVEKYVRPHVESGMVSTRDVYLMVFCLEAADAQAERLRRLAESEMGLMGRDFEDALPDVCLANQNYSSVAFRKRLPCLDGADAKRFESYCKKYNYKELQESFVDLDGLQKALAKGRKMENKHQKSIQSLAVSSDIYKACGQIDEMRGGFWMWLWRCFNPRYWNFEKRWAWNDVDKTRDNVCRFVDLLNSRIGYADVFDSSDGLYQRTYMNLARACHLLECWHGTGWKSSFALTDANRKDLGDWYEKAMMRSRDTLQYLEDTLVNRPLMCNMIEATSVNLHMNVLEAQEPEEYWLDSRKAEAKTVLGVRRDWLNNSKKVGDLCTKYANYSMAFMTQNEAWKYNFYLGQAYATNRLDMVYDRDEEELQRHFENAPPLFDLREKSRVEDGYVREKKAKVEYRQLADALSALSENALLRCLIVDTIDKDIASGDALVRTWMRDMTERFLPQCWMYPSWSEEAREWGIPKDSEKIVEQVEICQSDNCVVKKMQLVLCAMRRIAPELEVMERVFLDECASEDDLQSAKEEAGSFIEGKDLPSSVEAEIESHFGSIAGFVDSWFECLNLDLSANDKELEIVADRLMCDYLPLLIEIDNSNRRWWRWIWPF